MKRHGIAISDPHRDVSLIGMRVSRRRSRALFILVLRRWVRGVSSKGLAKERAIVAVAEAGAVRQARDTRLGGLPFSAGAEAALLLPDGGVSGFPARPNARTQRWRTFEIARAGAACARQTEAISTRGRRQRAGGSGGENTDMAPVFAGCSFLLKMQHPDGGIGRPAFPGKGLIRGIKTAAPSESW